MIKTLNIINTALFFLLSNNLSAANNTTNYDPYTPDNECTLGTFFRNTLGDGSTKFKALSEAHDLGDPLFFTKQSVYKELSSQIDILDRETFANFAKTAADMVLAKNGPITDPYFSCPYDYVRTILACPHVPIAKRSEFITHLTAEFKPGYNSAGKSYLANALAKANHMPETIANAKFFFTSSTSSYDISLIWSPLGKCKTAADIQDVVSKFITLRSLPCSMSFEHQNSMLMVLAHKNTEERNSFVTTIQPLTSMLTDNGIGWSVSKLSKLTPAELPSRVVTLISYVSEQKPDENTYLKHIGVFDYY